jgi:integrase/recombinase XerD
VNRSVNLTKRIKTPNGLRFCTVARSANGRIKANFVSIDGREQQHPEGSYYIEWYDGNKRLRRSVGKNALAAEAKRHQHEQMLTAKADGLKAGLKFAEESDRPSLVGAVTTYLAEIQLTKKPKTLAAYTTALDYFLESCKAQHVADVDRRHMLEFAAFLRDEKEQAPRSVYNKFENVMTFLKANKVRDIVGKTDWPRYTEEEPEIYEPEELTKLFNACDAEERLWYEFFLMTGMREQEVMYTYRSDVNCSGCIVRVTHKPDRGWTPKAYKEREIPIPAKLAASLKKWMAKADKSCNLLFPTAGCNPKLDFLDCLKAVAERAELDKSNFYLHKFRATFATRCLWAGIDLRTVQQWLGHSDIESTMRYLKPSRSSHVQEKVNEIFA